MAITFSTGRPDRVSARKGAVTTLLVLGMLTLAVLPALQVTAAMWSQEEYSHAWLILPLATLLFIQRFRIAQRGGDRRGGVAISALAVLMLFGGWLAHNTSLSVYGAIAALLGLTWSTVGLRGLKKTAAPIFYLIFIIPLPLAAYITLSQGMQQMSSKIGVALIGAMGIQVLRDGNVIDLVNGRLEVAEACNGLRYLFPLLSIAALLAMLLEDRLWKKIAIILSAFPIALVLNAVRLALIGFLVDRYGMEMAEGVQHEVEGFAVFALCVAGLIGEVWLLTKIGRGGRLSPLDALLPGRAAMAALSRWPASRAFLAASLVLMAGSAAVAALPQRVEVIPQRRPLTLFPMSIGPWRGKPDTLEPSVLQALGLTDYVVGNYLDQSGSDPRAVNFYVAYYASQRLGVQVHSPRLCIPGGGWDIVDQSTVSVPAPDGSTIPANRVVIEKGGVRQITYYWFDERGRRLTRETQIKTYALIDGVVRNRSDGALVRVVTPVIGSDEAQADQTIRDFIWASAPLMRKYLPD